MEKETTLNVIDKGETIAVVLWMIVEFMGIFGWLSWRERERT